MVKKIIYGFFFWCIGLGTIYAQKAPEGNRQRTLYYDKETGKFRAVAKTKTTTDSLLDLSWHSRNTDTSKSLSAARLGLRLADSLDYESGIARGHYLLGVTYQRVGDHEVALKHFLTALDMEIKRDDHVQVGKILNGIAIIYLRQENYEAAIDYFQQSIDLMKEIGNKKREGIATGNLGYVYFEQEQYTGALSHYNRALKLLEGTENSQLAYFIYKLNIGDTYVELGEFEQAKGILNQALDYFNQEGLVRTQSEIYLSLSRLYHKSGTHPSLALKYAQKGLKKARSINFKESIIAAYKQMGSIYESRNAYRKALYHYKNYKTVQDSLRNSDRSQRLNEMQARFDVEQKDRKIELLNKEAALQEAQLGRQKLWRTFMIIGIALLALIVGLLYRYNNQKKRANLLLGKKNKEIERKNEQLISFNNEKNEFMGMAAHDLRNPLSGITSVVSLIRSGEMTDNVEMKEYINLIGTSADRMLTLVNNLLNVNAIEGDDNQLEIAPINIQIPINQAVENFMNKAEEKDITLITSIDPQRKPVMADDDAIKRVLDNLISNAIKYSPTGSSIEISAKMLENDVELAVEDNGQGIPEEEQGQLFKRFSKISTQPTASEPSTGLGLFIVKRLAEKMNGTVRCESKKGEGTKFVVVLPVASQETKPA